MKMHIEYNNDNQPFEVDIPNQNGIGTPIMELKVEGTSGQSRKRALYDYLLNIELAFRDVRNTHETSINKFEIDDAMAKTFLTTTEDMDFNVDNDCSKFNTVIYNIYSDIFKEKLYFTKNEAKGVMRDVNLEVIDDNNLEFEGNLINREITGVNRGNELEFDGNLINREMLERKSPITKVFISSLVSITSKYFSDYAIKVVNDKTKGSKKLVFSYKGSVLNNIDEIKDDDAFIFFKFVEVLLHKERHVGIFLIDCSRLSANAIHAFCLFNLLYYKSESHIFLYNIPSGAGSKFKGINRKVITLPNHKIPVGAKCK